MQRQNNSNCEFMYSNALYVNGIRLSLQKNAL